jgi:hypothetical protein
MARQRFHLDDPPRPLLSEIDEGCQLIVLRLKSSLEMIESVGPCGSFLATFLSE